jgi:hypothetical protein
VTRCNILLESTYGYDRDGKWKIATAVREFLIALQYQGQNDESARRYNDAIRKASTIAQKNAPNAPPPPLPTSYDFTIIPEGLVEKYNMSDHDLRQFSFNYGIKARTIESIVSGFPLLRDVCLSICFAELGPEFAERLIELCDGELVDLKTKVHYCIKVLKNILAKAEISLQRNYPNTAIEMSRIILFCTRRFSEDIRAMFPDELNAMELKIRSIMQIALRKLQDS